MGVVMVLVGGAGNGWSWTVDGKNDMYPKKEANYCGIADVRDNPSVYNLQLPRFIYGQVQGGGNAQKRRLVITLNAKLAVGTGDGVAALRLRVELREGDQLRHEPDPLQRCREVLGPRVP